MSWIPTNKDLCVRNYKTHKETIHHEQESTETANHKIRSQMLQITGFLKTHLKQTGSQWLKPQMNKYKKRTILKIDEVLLKKKLGCLHLGDFFSLSLSVEPNIQHETAPTHCILTRSSKISPWVIHYHSFSKHLSTPAMCHQLCDAWNGGVGGVVQQVKKTDLPVGQR